MHPSLQQVFTRLEDQRSMILKEIQSISNEKLNQTPGPSAWSLAQVLSHIISSERLTLNYLQKKVQGAESLSESGFVEEVKSFLLMVSQRIPGIRFKAPKGIVEKTSPYHSVEEISAAWIQLRAELKSFLDAYPEQYLRTKVFRHPFAGYLNIIQGISFLREHIIHHTPQIKRLLR